MRPTGTVSNTEKIKSHTQKEMPLAVLQAGNKPIVGSYAEKVLRFIVGRKLTINQQHATTIAKANFILSCMHRKRAHSGNPEKCLFPFTCHTRPLQDYFVQLWLTQYSKNPDKEEFCRGHQYGIVRGWIS